MKTPKMLMVAFFYAGLVSMMLVDAPLQYDGSYVPSAAALDHLIYEEEADFFRLVSGSPIF